MRSLLERGGVIGGTSAGASICAEYLVRADPLSMETVMAEGYERGFGFLPGFSVDQHFTKRKRLPEMQQLHRWYPKLTAIGIDEATAVICRNGKLEVRGLGTVTLLNNENRPPRVMRAGDWVSLEVKN